MQNLVAHVEGGSGAEGQSAGGTGGSDDPQPLSEQESPEREQGREDGGQGVMSNSGRTSFTSLPTYTGPGSSYAPALGPFSASTSHINRLGTDKLDKPNYQNGLSASDSGRSSLGKSSSSYHRLCHLADMPAVIHPSPSSDDIIQDLEDRLWEKEQEVSEITWGRQWRIKSSLILMRPD